MATKKAATTNGHSNGHVSLAREEYGAFLAREESYQQLLADTERAKNINRDLTQTCDAQGQRLSMNDLMITHHERVGALQLLFIEMLRDGTKVASLEELSKFWQQWMIHTNKAIDDRKLQREEVAKYEPDLFRTWRNWVHDAGKKDRMFNEAGSRAERDASIPGTAREMQEHIIVRQRQENAKLANRVAQLEAEMEAFKNEKKKSQDNQPQEKRP